MTLFAGGSKKTPLVGVLPNTGKPVSEVVLAIGYNAISSAYSLIKGRYISKMVMPTYTDSAKLLLVALGESGCSSFYGWTEGSDEFSPPTHLNSGNINIVGSLVDHPKRSRSFMYRGEPLIHTKMVVCGRAYWLRVYKELVGDEGNSLEWLEVSTIGSGREVWAPLTEFIDNRLAVHKDTFTISSSMGNSWVLINEVSFRDPSTLILDNPSTESIVKDLTDFYYHSKPRYKRLGTPWRRGYFLKGVKGSGKSSLIMVMASAIQSDIYVINCEGCSDSDLIYLFSNLPKKAIVVFEDVDVIAGLTMDRVSDPSNTGKVSLSTLLNVLDGIYAKEGVVVIMTTNHPEVLDEALLREGRMDVTVEFKPLTYRQFAGMWELHYPTSEWDAATSARVVRLGWVSSKLQGILQRHPDDPVGAQKAIWEDSPGDEDFDMTDPFADDPECGDSYESKIGATPIPEDYTADEFYIDEDGDPDKPIHCHSCGDEIASGEYCASCRFGYR